MIRKSERKWFEVWGYEQEQNQILKIALLVVSLLLVLFSLITAYLASKDPILITINENSTKKIIASSPSPKTLQKELKRTLKNYMQGRHTWTPSTINESVKKALFYVEPQFKTKFWKANQNQFKIAKKKNISQKMYVYNVEIKEENKAIVKVDRILDIGGIRSSKDMIFEIKYVFRKRTQSNPEGIYITDEKLIN